MKECGKGGGLGQSLLLSRPFPRFSSLLSVSSYSQVLILNCCLFLLVGSRLYFPLSSISQVLILPFCLSFIGSHLYFLSLLSHRFSSLLSVSSFSQVLILTFSLVLLTGFVLTFCSRPSHRFSSFLSVSSFSQVLILPFCLFLLTVSHPSFLSVLHRFSS